MRFLLLFFIFSNFFLSNSFLLKNSMKMISDNNYFDIKLFTKNLIDKKGFVIKYPSSTFFRITSIF